MTGEPGVFGLQGEPLAGTVLRIDAKALLFVARAG